MKKHTQRSINRLAKWKYLVLVMTLLVMLLSALPSVFGENTALHISHRGHATDATLLSHTLKQANITPMSIEQNGDTTVMIFNDATQQAQAQVLLKEHLPESTTVALAMEPAAPKWLLNAGFTPIALGLDLRGGVQFLLEVDMEPVYQAHRQMVIDEFSREIRASRGETLTSRFK